MTRPASSAPEPTTPVVLLKRRSHAEQLADRCVHFNGIMHDRCEAGVDYHSVRLEHAPIAYRREGEARYTQTQTASRPCHDSMNLGGAACEKRCAPTPESVAAEVEASQREFGFTMEAMKRVIDATNNARGDSGSVECPKCGKPLRYSVAGSNGHIHGRCTTEGCLAWMQ